MKIKAGDTKPIPKVGDRVIFLNCEYIATDRVDTDGDILFIPTDGTQDNRYFYWGKPCWVAEVELITSDTNTQLKTPPTSEAKSG
jgi:hypothetical protein